MRIAPLEVYIARVEEGGLYPLRRKGLRTRLHSKIPTQEIAANSYQK